MAAGASALAQKLSRFLPLKPDELESLAGLEARRRAIPAHTELVHERQTGHQAFILLEGWACAYKLLPDGGRQVIDFSIPGDFMGLRSVLLRTSDHAFAAVSDILVAEVSAGQMIDTFQRRPRLAAAILWAASRDEAMVVEHLVSIGRRSALVRMAHLLLELGLRLQLVGLGSPGGYACPLNQYLLADALGLTAIHVNRVLRQLRERGLVTLREEQVEFHDPAGLHSLAGYHTGYLDQGEGPAS
ncbi:Crp/Fnr family transcriptional regulator [Marinimicrococcus flavescens]|uniref:Crp/Fnr family transcriptional regulator n=1 Tax=Marinimicrococcus flavescens TaxID=3031815 RepID=A0AAP3V196_9PROT|nr:Crp/Fnr family transcriptional regulator [Marinimicrococcus flavescens]